MPDQGCCNRPSGGCVPGYWTKVRGTYQYQVDEALEIIDPPRRRRGTAVRALGPDKWPWQEQARQNQATRCRDALPWPLSPGEADILARHSIPGGVTWRS